MKNDFIQELYNLYSSKKMKNFFEFAQGEKREPYKKKESSQINS